MRAARHTTHLHVAATKLQCSPRNHHSRLSNNKVAMHLGGVQGVLPRLVRISLRSSLHHRRMLLQLQCHPLRLARSAMPLQALVAWLAGSCKRSPQVPTRSAAPTPLPASYRAARPGGGRLPSRSSRARCVRNSVRPNRSAMLVLIAAPCCSRVSSLLSLIVDAWGHD